jgi:hypothetical protein
MNKINYNEHYFDEIDTESKAYLLGFFIADGYLTNDKKNNKRICINQSIDDINIVEAFKNELAPNANITKSNKQSGAKFRKPQISLRLSSKHMYDLLESKYKILKAKTFNESFKFPFEHIPNELIRHFIRGYFDGDGCVSFTIKNDLFNMSFSMVFNSIIFCNQIAEIMEKELNIRKATYSHIGKTANYYTLQFRYNRDATNAFKRIYEYFYNDSLLFLKRKKQKFLNYFEYRANSGYNKPGQRRA